MISKYEPEKQYVIGVKEFDDGEFEEHEIHCAVIMIIIQSTIQQDTVKYNTVFTLRSKLRTVSN